jgi:hypothetical protein
MLYHGGIWAKNAPSFALAVEPKARSALAAAGIPLVLTALAAVS